MRTRTTLLSSNNITVNPWVHTLYLLILHVSTIALAAALLELLFARRRGHSVGQVLLQCSKRVGDKGGVREDLLHVLCLVYHQLLPPLTAHRLLGRLLHSLGGRRSLPHTLLTGVDQIIERAAEAGDGTQHAGIGGPLLLLLLHCLARRGVCLQLLHKLALPV